MAALKLYESCRNLSEEIQSSVKVVEFNRQLCEYLAIRYADSFPAGSFQQLTAECESQCGSSVCVSDCEPALRELQRLMRDGTRLVEACKSKDWWRRAVVHADDAAFDERVFGHLLEFLGCVDSLRAALAEATGDQSFSSKPTVESLDDFHREVVEIGREDTDFLKREVQRKKLLAGDPLAAFLHARLTGTAQFATMDTDAIEFPDSNVVRDLGQGVFGRVQKCVWHGEAVAVKSMHNSADRTTLAQEAQVLEGLSHPNVVHLVGLGRREETDLLVMELMDTDLSRWMEESLDFKDPLIVLDIILQIARGLQYLHSPKPPPRNKVIHRDVKPLNVLLTRPTGAESAGHVRVKVADFGMSKTKELISHFTTARVGSPLYTAPEILRRRSNNADLRSDELYTWSSDVWSFAISVSEILTRQAPFGSSAAQLLKRLVVDGERPALPSTLPPYFAAFIAKCWDTTPSNRPSFDDICDMLLFCKNASLRGRMPSNVASINEYNARMFLKHLGRKWCLHEGSLHHKLISLETYYKVRSKSEPQGERLSRTELLLAAKSSGDWTGPKQEFERAVRLFQFVAEKLHDPEALWRLGLCFELGLGTEVNMARAVKNYQLASDLGFRVADVELGLCYAVPGRVVPGVDLKAAAQHWKKALSIREEGVKGKKQADVDSIGELIQHTVSWLEAEGGDLTSAALGSVKGAGGMRAYQRLMEITGSQLSEGKRLVAGHKCCNIEDLVQRAQKPKFALLRNLLNNLSKDEEIKKIVLSLQPVWSRWLSRWW